MLTQDYTTVISNLLAGKLEYLPNYLYVEFTNSTVDSLPDDTQGREYYESLVDPVGYLRIPIPIKPTVSNNKITFTVLVTRTTSENSVEFGSDSTIYGVALVAARDPMDPTQDVVFAREYFNGENQLVMGSNQTFCFSFKLGVFDSNTPVDEDFWDELPDEA